MQLTDALSRFSSFQQADKIPLDLPDNYTQLHL